MLFELSGLATIRDIKEEASGFVKLNISFSDTTVRGENEYKNFGNRWVNLTKAQSQDVINESRDSGGVEALKGFLVEVTAAAITDKNGERYFDNYRVSEINFLGGPEAAQSVNNQKIFLKGVGNIRKVSRVTDKLAKLLVISSERYGEDETSGNRWVTVTGKSAEWFISRGDDLIGESLQFKAKASTDSRESESGKNFFENYMVNQSRVIWTKRKQDQ